MCDDCRVMTGWLTRLELEDGAAWVLAESGSGERRISVLEGEPQGPPSRWLRRGPPPALAVTWDATPSFAGRHLPPVRPSKIVGIGRSYREHAVELGNEPPAEPLVFLKAPSSLLPSGGVLRLPEASAQVEYEGELALVVGSVMTAVAPAEVPDRLLGVTLACDCTARDLQRRDRTFARAKSFDTFCPLGPAIRLDPDWDSLTLTTRVNGDERQSGHVSELTWTLFELASYVSHVMTLEPGDVLLTGTPPGVGALEPGAEVEIASGQIGSLRFTAGERES